MNFNRNNFNNPNPQIWETRNNVNSNNINPNPQFFNNYYGNQPQGNNNLINYPIFNNNNNNVNNNNNNNNGNNNIATDYQQPFGPPRPLLSLNLSKKEKKIRNYNNHYQFKKKNSKQKWNDYNRDKPRSSEIEKDQRETYKNFHPESNDSFETNHNTFDVSNPVKTKSLVETLKAAQSSILNKNESSVNETPSNEKEINAICAKNATDVTKKLFSQLKTMNKSTIRDLINNPKLKHETALKAHAREKLRQEMRKQLKILSAESNSDVQLEPDMCVDSDKIPDMLIDEIEKTLEMSLFDFRDDDRNIIENNSTAEDKDIEVVKQNLGNDFFLGSEMLLMNGFSLLDSLPSDNLNKNSISDEDVKKIDLIEHQSTTSTIPVNIFNVPTPVPPPFVPTLVPPPFVLEKIVPEIERNSQPFTSIDTTCSSIIPIKTNDIIADDDWNDDLETPATSDKLIKIESRVDSFFNEPKLSTIRSEIELNVEPASSPNNDFFLNKPDRYSDCQPEPCFEEKKEEPKQTYGSYKREKHYRIDKQTSVEKMEPKKSPLDSSQFNKTPPKNNNNNNNKNNRFDKNARKYDDKRRKSRFDTPRVDNNTTSYDRNKFHINDTEKVPYTRFEPPWNNRPPIIPEKIDDGPSYRFKEKESTQDPDLEQLTSILQPKSFQFKGSFLKPSRNNNNNNNNNNINNRPNKRPLSNTWEPERRSTSNNYSRSRSRDRTDNHDRINYNQSPSSIKETTPAQEDIRPCFNILKKVQEIDSEITKVHEKLHGIDKVIMNLQTEKIGIQKSFSRLQNERKILFESLMKKATAANNLTIENKTEVKSTAVKPVPSTNKTQINKKLQDIVDRKRKNDHTDIKQDELKKRKAIDVVTTSAEQSCTKIVPVEKTATVSHILDNEDPKVTERNKAKKVQNIQKHHPQDNVDGKLKSTKVNPTRCNEIVKSLDNKVNNVNDNDSAIKYKIIVSKPTSQKKSPKLIKRRSITPKQLFIKEDIIDVDNYVIKNLNVMLSKLPSNLAFNVDIDVDVMEAIKVEPLTDELVPCSNLNETLSFDNELEFVQKQEQLDYVEAMNDRPLTPGSDFIFNDQILDTNYLEWTGNFESHTKPITHLMSVQNQFLICASEDGKIYKYSITDGTLLGLFTKHTDICNYFIFDGSHICSVSSDGFVHRIKLDTFECIASAHFDESLQILEKSSGIFLGAKSGKIFKLKFDLTNDGIESPLCDLGSQIYCIRADKEGPRKILLVSSRAHSIQIRDQNDGLLLRTFCDALNYVNIFDILVIQSEVFCGSNRNEILTADFITGVLKKSFLTIGAGIISLKLIRNFLIAACTDGNIYVFDTKTEGSTAITSISGPGNMLLSMDLWENKIIASTKDGRVKIINFQM